jgi:hypothetical protein
MSAKQCRMSPTRYRPVIRGVSGLPSTAAIIRATSATDVDRPLPMLIARPAAWGTSSASRQACTTSPTLTKSRRWHPSSNTSGARSLSSCEAKIASTPVYGLESACRGPKTLKNRSATVGMP